MDIELIKQQASAACEDFDVSRLDLYGSMARGTSTPDSDVDLLVEFQNPEQKAAKRFFGLLHRLETSLGRPVDLLTTNSLKNPYFKRKVMGEKISLYER